MHLLCAKSCARLRELQSRLPKLCYFFLAASPAQKQAKCTCEDRREPGAWEPAECSKSATCTCTPVPTGVSGFANKCLLTRRGGRFFAVALFYRTLSMASHLELIQQIYQEPLCAGQELGDLSPAPQEPTADWGSLSFTHSLTPPPNESLLNANCKAGAVLVNSAHTAPAIQGGGGGGGGGRDS